MNPTPRAWDVAGGYALAVAFLGLAVYLRLVIPVDPAGHYVTILLYFVAIVAAGRATFHWGALRGFPVRRENRRLNYPNLARNLVMAALAMSLLLFFSGPVVRFAVALAR